MYLQEQYITAKYVDRRYATGCVPAVKGVPQTALWDAVEGGSIRSVVFSTFVYQSPLIQSFATEWWALYALICILYGIRRHNKDAQNKPAWQDRTWPTHT